MSIEINTTETNGLLVESFLNKKEAFSCFVPICPYSFMANKPFLQEYIPWMLDITENILVVIGDYLERHNISFFNCISMEDAWEKARVKGNKIINTINSLIPKGRSNRNIVVKSSAEFIQESQCQQIIRKLQFYIDDNSAFREDIVTQTRRMLENTNRMPDGEQIVSNSVLNRLCKYMLEEIALYLLLYQRGFQIELYPGKDMKILQKIARKKYKEFPYQYRYRTHISVVVSPDMPFLYTNGQENF